MSKNLSLIIFSILLIFISCADVGEKKEPEDKQPPYQTSFKLSDFQEATSCRPCHPIHYDEWINSMHAYSMKDPVFHSGWRGEQEHRPETGERFCIQCHSPYAFVSESEVDTTIELIAEGIGCDLCHTMTQIHEAIITEDNVAASASYYLNAADGIKYGQIIDPVETSAHKSEGLSIFEKSQICLPCHDFIIRGVDAEITVIEWAESAFSAMGIECQTCHMASYKGYAVDPYFFPDAPERTVHKHDFVGVDLDLTRPLSENPQKNAVIDMLKSGAELYWALEPVIYDTNSTIDSINFSIAIKNLTGHSFPTGVSFVRELWLEVTLDGEIETYFASGVLQSDSSDIPEGVEIFNAILYDEQGNAGSGVTDVFSMTNNSLETFETRIKSYSISPVGVQTTESLTLKARLLFRPFPPASLRGGHDDLLENLPVIVVDSLQFEL